VSLMPISRNTGLLLAMLIDIIVIALLLVFSKYLGPLLGLILVVPVAFLIAILAEGGFFGKRIGWRISRIAVGVGEVSAGMISLLFFDVFVFAYGPIFLLLELILLLAGLILVFVGARRVYSGLK